ncbi:MAG: hypothetical protein WBA93_35615 [Microcoleaceae cyanobacterium]
MGEKEKLGGRIVCLIFQPLSAQPGKYFEQLGFKKWHFFRINKGVYIDM